MRLRERCATAALGAYFLVEKWTDAAASRGATSSPTWTSSWRRRRVAAARRLQAAPRLPTSSAQYWPHPAPALRPRLKGMRAKTTRRYWKRVNRSCRSAVARHNGVVAGDGRRPTARLERRSERARVRRQTWARGDGLRRHGQPGGRPRRRARRRRLLGRRRHHTHYRAPARFPAARLRYFVGPLQNLVGLIHFLLWASSEIGLELCLDGRDYDLMELDRLLCRSQAKVVFGVSMSIFSKNSVSDTGNNQPGQVLSTVNVYNSWFQEGAEGSHLTDSYCTLVIVAIEIVIGLDRSSEPLSRQPSVLHPWTMRGYNFRLWYL